MPVPEGDITTSNILSTEEIEIELELDEEEDPT
jgi:hypothetical protein